MGSEVANNFCSRDVSQVFGFFVNIKVQPWVLNSSNSVVITRVNFFIVSSNKPLNIAILEGCVLCIGVDEFLDKGPQAISVQKIFTHAESVRVETFN